jgi:hypothetical protein
MTEVDLLTATVVLRKARDASYSTCLTEINLDLLVW